MSWLVLVGCAVSACGGKSDVDPDACGDCHEGVSVSAGSLHTCAVTREGQVKCWGANHRGQLGDGSFTARNTPATVIGLAAATSVVVAEEHSCAVAGGDVWCWGNGNPEPAKVSGLSPGVRAIATGQAHHCAIAQSGALVCWGFNGFGQLGNGTTDSTSSPTDVVGLAEGVVAVSASGSRTCAVTADGVLKCWGAGLLDNSDAAQTVPTTVDGISSRSVNVSVGPNHMCAVLDTGGIECWGSNAFGQLGDGTDTHSAIPVSVSGLSAAAADVSAGAYHSCALTVAGGVACWGVRLLGNGSTVASFTPTPIADLSSGVVEVSAGAHTCAIIEGGLVCWGGNAVGQLGDGTNEARPAPAQVVGF